MLNWWEILEVEKGADLRTIKRAYAKKLKTIRQEDDPEAFMELREAYEDAQGYLRYAKSNSYQSEVQIQVTTASPQGEPDVGYVENKEALHPSEPTSMDEVKALLKNPWSAKNLDKWNEIFDDEKLESIDNYTDFEQDLIYYLVEIYSKPTKAARRPILSLPVAKLIFERFRWDSKNRIKNRLINHITWLETQIEERLPSHLTASKTTPDLTEVETPEPIPSPPRPKQPYSILKKSIALTMLGAYIYWVSTLFR